MVARKTGSRRKYGTKAGEKVGRAMLNVARKGFDKQVLESDDINRAAEL